MLSSRIVHILNFFDVCGYCTESSALTKFRKIRFLIFFTHFSLAILFTIFMFYIFVEYIQIIGLLETINELVQYCIGLLTYWLIILDSFAHSRKHERFWRIVQTIDELFRKQNAVHARYLNKFIGFFLVTIASHTIIYYQAVLPQTISVFVFVALITIGQLRVFYYIFCLEIVNCQLKMIENEIKIMRKTVPIIEGYDQHLDNTQGNSFCEFKLKRFKWINGYYHCVVQMTELLNDIFGWSQVASILFFFHSLQTNLNMLYTNIIRFSFIQLLSKLFI